MLYLKGHTVSQKVSIWVLRLILILNTGEITLVTLYNLYGTYMLFDTACFVVVFDCGPRFCMKIYALIFVETTCLFLCSTARRKTNFFYPN